MFQIIENERIQIKAFALLSAGALVLTASACINHTDLFNRFIDFLHPEFVVYLISLAGLIAILLLTSTAPFFILRETPYKGILWSLLLALPFGIVIILIDLLAPFPEDIALPFPESLLIYPAMGFVAEIIFHILPFTILVLALNKVLKNVSIKIIVGIHILLFSLCQLLFFRRYDFFTMNTFRMTYYLIWHVAWGTIRLNILY